MAVEQTHRTLDIVTDYKIGDKTYTPQQRIVPIGDADKLIAAGVAFEVKPGMTTTQVQEATLKLHKAQDKAEPAPTVTQSK